MPEDILTGISRESDGGVGGEAEFVGEIDGEATPDAGVGPMIVFEGELFGGDSLEASGGVVGRALESVFVLFFGNGEASDSKVF